MAKSVAASADAVRAVVLLAGMILLGVAFAGLFAAGPASAAESHPTADTGQTPTATCALAATASAGATPRPDCTVSMRTRRGATDSKRDGAWRVIVPTSTPDPASAGYGAPRTNLPTTGLDVSGMLTLGATLVVAGALMLTVRRRGQQRSTLAVVPADETHTWHAPTQELPVWHRPE